MRQKTRAAILKDNRIRTALAPGGMLGAANARRTENGSTLHLSSSSRSGNYPADAAGGAGSGRSRKRRAGGEQGGLTGRVPEDS